MSDQLQLARLNEDGILAFEHYIQACNNGQSVAFPVEILSGQAFCTPVSPKAIIETRKFETRFELARYLTETFDAAGLRAQRSDSGLWTWLACAYFMKISRAGGGSTPGAVPRWVFRNTDFRRYYRHLVAGPFFIYQAHRDQPARAMALLCQPPGKPGDVVEQLASRQEIVTNKAIMAVATAALVEAGPPAKLRRGAGGKGRGSARRFVDVIAQFEMTWDLSMMSPEQLGEIMPTEFSGKR